MKIYTKTGDSGETGLFGGKRVPKDEFRIECYGTIDELNSHLGIIDSYSIPQLREDFIQDIQSILFDIGSHLATDPEKEMKLPPLVDSSIEELESTIDTLDAELEPLTFFILPGGSLSSAQCHVARTVCRRAERRIIALGRNEPLNPFILKYINRLSDFLFILARTLLSNEGGKEIAWKPRK